MEFDQRQSIRIGEQMDVDRQAAAPICMRIWVYDVTFGMKLACESIWLHSQEQATTLWLYINRVDFC